MAPTEPQLASLRQWLEDSNGFLHPAVRIDHNDQAGVHLRVAADVAADSRICTIPHSLTLSSLNALADDAFPAFKNRGLAVEAIGYFFLMHEYLNRTNSFWKPYLDTLPGPDEDCHRTPFYFDQEEDLAWLEDTDVLFTAKARQETHETHYQQGISLIKAANIDAEPYTRALYQWAVTIFTSRSFSSHALRPHDSKYWSAYKTGQEGRRQTVLLDMSRATGEELDFPVLFPVMDIPNHAADAKVSWNFDPGRFSMKTQDDLVNGDELFNNYGPKRNDELLLGYGFCISNNPNEKVLLTMKAPPPGLQDDVRRIQPGYFDQQGQWSSEKATFAIDFIDYDQQRPEIFDQLPEPLVELMLYILRHERELPFSFFERPTRYLTAEGGRQYLPHITRMIVQSLLPKMAKLQGSMPRAPPSNHKQATAKIYRDGQITILESITGALRNYLRSLLYPAIPHPTTGPSLVTLEGLLDLLRLRCGPQPCNDFLKGLSASSGTQIVEQLREAGWEDDAMVLLLCFVYSLCDMSMPEYMAQAAEPADDESEQARSAMELVEAAREVCPGSFWQDRRWNELFIFSLGGRLLKFESFVMMVPTSQDTGDARLVVYIHG